MFANFVSLYYPNGTLKYEGEAINKTPSGYGKEYYENSNPKYIGKWANGKYHGTGTLYDESGKSSRKAL